MSAVATPKRYTREDYKKLPEGPPYFELIEGEFIETSRPLRPHYLAAGFLHRIWANHLVETIGGELAQEPNLYLPQVEEVYHPDLVYVAQERRRICENDGIYGAPDVICEILSQNTRKRDRYVKMPVFQHAGVPHIWLIEPEAPVAIEEYVRNTDGSYSMRAILSAPAIWEPSAFPGWRIDLAELADAVSPASD